MKKGYEVPKAEKLEFNYSENVTASSGHKYLLFTEVEKGCNQKPSDPPVWVDGNMDESCTF